ncbi:MAG: TRAP transporter substrate-binding protein DctP, partial [Thermodesulfobacteriota bacterium]
MKRSLFWVAILAFAFLAGTWSPLTAAAQDQKVFELKFAWNDIWGPKFRTSQVYRPCGEMQRLVEERSGGRLKIKIIPRMFPTDQLLQAVATGKADMADVAMPWESGTYPLWNWGEIPGVVDEDPIKGLAEELAVYEDPKVMEVYDRTLKDVNLKFWFVTQWDPANGIWSKKTITALEDLKGMKVRVGGYLPTLGIKALGASPVTIAGSELAPAMMAGTIDGVLTSLGYGYSIGLAKVSSSFTLTPLSPTWTAVTLMNRQKFDSLPPDLQQVLIEVGQELQRMVSLSTTAEYILSIDTVDLSGIKRLTLDPAEQKKALEACKVVEDEWLQKTGDDGQELLPAIKAAV